jgi:hypothetical protein
MHCIIVVVAAPALLEDVRNNFLAAVVFEP